MTLTKKLAIIRALVHAEAIRQAKAESAARGKYALTFHKQPKEQK